MKIIGSYLGIHDNGFSLIEDNDIVACYSEERFSRIKSAYNQYKFPINSFNSLKEDFNIDINDKDVIFASAKPVSIEIPEVLELVKNKGLKLYSHQYSHACGAYYTSGFDDDTLVVSYDGGDCGDDNFTELNIHNVDKYFPYKINTYSGVFVVKDGKLIEVHHKQKHGSVAHLWPVFCHIFGLTPLKDEGKIMGLATQGEFDSKIYNQLKFFVDKDQYSSGWIILEHYIKLLNSLNEYDAWQLKKNLAFNLQYITEITMVDYIKNLNDKYGPFKNLCVAGGIFANVKLNQKINEELSFENMWVYPAMGDEGLSLGSAIACAVELGVFDNRKLKNVFLGKKYSEVFIENEINNFEKKFNNALNVDDLDFTDVAELLSDGKIVAIYKDSAEYGPRALGNRSVLVDPRNKENHEYLNNRLERDEIMPFAPIILEEYISDICHYHKSKHTSKFMTMCYTVKDEWVDKIPAVINTYDNTARPQVVSIENEYFYKILTEFNKITNVPVLLNTSFNGHGEPIVNSPNDALSHLSRGTIDYLIINNKLLSLYEK